MSRVSISALKVINGLVPLMRVPCTMFSVVRPTTKPGVPVMPAFLASLIPCLNPSLVSAGGQTGFEGRIIQPNRFCLPENIFRAILPSVKKGIAHFPELVLLTRAVSRNGGRLGMLMKPQRQVTQDKTQFTRIDIMLPQLLIRLQIKLSAKRALVVGELHHRYRCIQVIQNGIAQGGNIGRFRA